MADRDRRDLVMAQRAALGTAVRMPSPAVCGARASPEVVQPGEQPVAAPAPDGAATAAQQPTAPQCDVPVTMVELQRTLFLSAAHRHLTKLVAQLLRSEGVPQWEQWVGTVTNLAAAAAAAVSPSAITSLGVLDPRHYIKVCDCACMHVCVCVCVRVPARDKQETKYRPAPSAAWACWTRGTTSRWASTRVCVSAHMHARVSTGMGRNAHAAACMDHASTQHAA